MSIIPDQDQKLLIDVAEKLSGVQYREETTKEIEEFCKQNNIVILFGASDDLAEFRGAVNDNVDCYNGKVIVKEPEIHAVWQPTEGLSWAYNLQIDHAQFDVYEDDKLYCRGVVFYKPENFKLKD